MLTGGQHPLSHMMPTPSKTYGTNSRSLFTGKSNHTAAQAGLEDSAIKALGRWNSLAFLLYTHTPRDQIASLTHCLAKIPAISRANVAISSGSRSANYGSPVWKLIISTYTYSSCKFSNAFCHLCDHLCWIGGVFPVNSGLFKLWAGIVPQIGHTFTSVDESWVSLVLRHHCSFNGCCC